MPSSVFRRFAAAVLVQVSLLGGAALAAPLTLAVARSPLALPVFVAEAESFFADEGLDLRIVEASTGRRCLEMMAQGQADMATAADTAIMFHSFEHHDFVVLASFFSTTSDAKLIVRQSAGIRTPKDLEGKRIGVVRGTSAHYFLDAYLLIHGVDPKALQRVPVQPENAVKLLQQNQVDALAVFEPVAYQAISAMPQQVIVLPDPGTYTQTFNLVARRGLAGAQDPVLVRMLRALQRAEALIREHPARAQAILRARLGVDQAFVTWIWPRRAPELSLDNALLKSLRNQARWALREGYVAGPTAPNYLEFVHPAPLSQVQPEAVGLAH